MEFNIQKCKVIHIGHSISDYKYFMDNQYVQEVNDEKDLGIMIMNDWKSAAQVMEATKKANRAVEIIRHTKKYKSKSVLLSPYK